MLAGDMRSKPKMAPIIAVDTAVKREQPINSRPIFLWSLLVIHWPRAMTKEEPKPCACVDAPTGLSMVVIFGWSPRDTPPVFSNHGGEYA